MWILYPSRRPPDTGLWVYMSIALLIASYFTYRYVQEGRLETGSTSGNKGCVCPP